MSIPTVTITGNVLPPNNVAAGGTVSFELNTVAVDLGSGVVVPRKVSTPILSGGAISQAIWPNAAGENPSRYAVYLEMIPALDGDCPVRIKLGEIVIPVSPSSQDIGALIAAGSAATGGAALLEFQFANRAALVAKVASGLVPIPGFTYLAGGLGYLGKTGATDIPDLPGLVPAPLVASIAWDDVTDKPATFPPSAHTHPVSAISGSTAAGRSMVTAADAAAQRALLSVETTTQLNTRDTNNRNRANHTGTQAISTVTGLQAALDGRVTQPYANRAAAVAALPTLPAAVTRIGWYDGNVLLEVVKAPGAGLLPSMADWVPVAPHRLQHWGIAVYGNPTAARTALGAMSAGERTAHQAALASAFGDAVGLLILDGWVEATDHIIINPYRTVDMSVPTDLGGITVGPARFNMLAEAIVSGGTSVRGCHIKNLHISCGQASPLTRGTVVAYPPAFVPRGDFGRCDFLRIATANEGIAEAPGGSNNGGWTFGRVEISCFGRPFNFQGDLHHVTVTDMIDVWVYGMTPSQIEVAYDGATPFARIGRVDTFSAESIKIFRQCGLEIDSDFNGAPGGLNEGIPIMINKYAGDGEDAQLHFKSGRSLIGMGYGTEDAGTPPIDWKILCEGGDHTINAYDFVGDAVAVVKVTNGHLKMISPTFYNTNVTVGQAARVEGTGELTLISPRLRWPNGVRSVPFIEQAGAGAILRVIDPIVDPLITTGTDVIKYNNDNAGNVLRAETIAPHAAVFTGTWTAGWYKASGTTSLRPRVQDNLIIDNGAADGGNITFRSAGDPSWDIDNRFGQLRFVRDAVARVGFTGTTASINLQITGTAVTQSATDTTAGRLLKVGDFGIGSDMPAPGGDANQCVVPGFNYRFSTVGVNTPLGNPYGSTLHVFEGNEPSRLQQMFVQASNGHPFFRGSVDGGVTWSAWKSLVAIRGSTANGEWVRHADGTMECWHTQNSSSAGAATWTFPTDVPFVGTVNVQVTPGATVLRTATHASTATPTLTADFRCFDSAGALTTTGCNLVAKGRWF